MLKILFSIIIAFSFSLNGFAQKRKIKIEDEIEKNRLVLYAVNENLQDFDILLTVKGTGFRQRAGKPRLTRIPGASRVKVQSLVIERGEEPLYTYLIVANDSLSRRVIKPEFTKIKIDPIKPITVYTSERCISCDTLIQSLDNGTYKYKSINLSENEKKADALKKYVIGLDTITSPIINFGGILHTDIIDYDQLLEKMLNKNTD